MVRIVYGTKSPQMVRNVYGTKSLVPYSITQKIGQYLDTPRLPFLSDYYIMGFCSGGPCECTYQIWSSYSFTRSWDNKGYSKIWAVPGYAHSQFLWAFVLEIGGTQSLDTPRLPFLPNFSWAFVLVDPVNVPAKFEVRSFTRSWDNKGYSKIWAIPGYAHSQFLWAFVPVFLWMYLPNLKS